MASRPPKPANGPSDEWVAIGVIVGAHGVRGELRVAPQSDIPGRLAGMEQVTLALPDGRRVEGRVEGIRPHTGKGVELVRLAGCANRTQAEALKGARLVVRREDSPKLPEGDYYDWQIIGLRAFTTDGRDLGQIREILRTGANDVYVTDEHLLPATAEVVKEIDPEGGRLVIEPLPGLLE